MIRMGQQDLWLLSGLMATVLFFVSVCGIFHTVIWGSYTLADVGHVIIIFFFFFVVGKCPASSSRARSRLPQFFACCCRLFRSAGNTEATLKLKNVSRELGGGKKASREVGNRCFFPPNFIFYKLECTGGKS